MANDQQKEIKVPFVAHCGLCNHEWNVAYLPMELSKVARLAKIAACPMCADENNVLCGFAEKKEIKSA